jgi:hypothetical protein
MNVEIGTEAAQFSEEKYINWDFRCSVREKSYVSPLYRKEKAYLSGLYGREKLLRPTWIRRTKIACRA